MTQVEFADVLHLNPTYISQLETGDRPLDDYYLVRAQEALTDFVKAKSIAPSGGLVLRDRDQVESLDISTALKSLRIQAQGLVDQIEIYEARLSEAEPDQVNRIETGDSEKTRENAT